MSIPERVLSDPRLVKGTLGGKEYHFWLHRRGYRIAREKHGYDPEAAPGDALDGILRFLWIAALPFAPDVSFDEFDLSITASEHEELVRLHNEVVERQIGSEVIEKKPTPRKKKKV